MKSLLLTTNTILQYCDIDLDNVAGMVLVKVGYAGICGSDIARAFNNGAYHYPLVMGHEFAGTVAETPVGSKFAHGDRVAVYPLLSCGKCPACNDGEYQLCSNYDYYGSRRNGGFAEYVYVPETNLVRVPDNVSLKMAAMTEPAAVAHHGVSKLELAPGASALVIGSGPIGNIAAQWLRLQGCEKVIVADIDDHKLAIAREMGFTVVNSSRHKLYDFIATQTNGEGIDNCIEACGLPLTCRQAVEMAARGGRVLLLGNISGDLLLPQQLYSTLLRRELRLFGSWNSKLAENWKITLEAMHGDLQLSPLISNEVTLSEGADIFTEIHTKRQFFNKVMFRVGGES